MSAADPALRAPAERLVVVLVEPQHSGNIGACIRAMTNMGLHRLVVVDPPCLDPMRVRWMAPGCDDVVASMRIVATLEQALEGCHRAVASTARHRASHQPVVDPATFAAQHWDRADDTVTALLFGREDFGLSREHVDRCESVLRIPTPEHASLNLGQAVLVVANHWYEAGRARGVEASGRILGGRRGHKPTRDLEGAHPRDEPAELAHLEPAAAALVELLAQVGYTRGTRPERVRQTARQTLQGAGLTIRQVETLRGMIRKVKWTLDHPDGPEG